MAARELGYVSIEDALAAELGDKRWPKLAERWHARFVSETPGIGVDESALALCCGQRPERATLRASRRDPAATRLTPIAVHTIGARHQPLKPANGAHPPTRGSGTCPDFRASARPSADSGPQAGVLERARPTPLSRFQQKTTRCGKSEETPRTDTWRGCRRWELRRGSRLARLALFALRDRSRGRDKSADVQNGGAT